jgi:membrane-associated phospholipid phosphatase
MSWTLLIILLAACAILMLLERLGLPTTLDLHFKGDVKRETRWLAQYGQSVATPVAALLVYQLDPSPKPGPLYKALAVLAAVSAASVSAMLLKRTLGRVRPGRERAGQFLGPALRHANYRESFPSSHSACATALSVMLAVLYPPAATTFWGLAIACAVLRYLLDAHWPSDVLGGIALGYALAHATLHAWHRFGWL